jgi:hypothetical protein
MKINVPLRVLGWASCLGGSLLAGGYSIDAAQAGGLPAVAERVAALEALVSQQSNQIAALMRALDAEARTRLAADTALQAQINNSLQPSPFTSAEIETLQGLARVVSVDRTNIHFAASICVGGDIGVPPAHTLFVSHVQPSDGACSGDLAGITVFDGNVGIRATNTLYVYNLRAFEALPPSPQELLEFGASMPPFTINGAGPAATVIMYGPVLFRREE